MQAIKYVVREETVSKIIALIKSEEHMIWMVIAKIGPLKKKKGKKKDSE